MLCYKKHTSSTQSLRTFVGVPVHLQEICSPLERLEDRDAVLGWEEAEIGLPVGDCLHRFNGFPLHSFRGQAADPDILLSVLEAALLQLLDLRLHSLHPVVELSWWHVPLQVGHSRRVVLTNDLGKNLHSRHILQRAIGVVAITFHPTPHCLKAAVVALEVVIKPGDHSSKAYA